VTVAFGSTLSTRPTNQNVSHDWSYGCTGSLLVVQLAITWCIGALIAGQRHRQDQEPTIVCTKIWPARMPSVRA
jgi:hypothetical protein